MANIRYLGHATAVAQVWEAEIDAFDAATTYGITINGKTISLLGDTDAATTIAALIVLLNASTIPEFAEITWAEGSTNTHAQGTSDTAGLSFTATTYTNAGTGTMDPTTGNSMTEVTANAGPNDVRSLENYSGGALPTNSDTLILENSDVDLLYGLEQFATNTFPVIQHQTYTGNIGLPDTNTTGTAYREYRTTHFQMKSTSYRIGTGIGDGSQRTRLDFNGATGVVLTVENTGSAEDTYLGALQVKGMTGTLNAHRGDIGVAILESETATLTTVSIGSANVRCGTGCSVTDWNVYGQGQFSFRTITGTSNGVLDAGNVTMAGTAGADTININGGTLVKTSSGDITTSLTVGAGRFDNSQNINATTVAATTVYDGAAIDDRNGLITWTADIITGTKTRLESVTIDLGQPVHINTA